MHPACSARSARTSSGRSPVAATIERHHRLIIAGLAFIILFFLAACLFHDVIPICHFLFGCDHAMH
jgi:hypothetical protein